MRWQQLLRRPAFLIALGVFLAIGAVWTVTAVSAAQPRTLDERTLMVAQQIQCPVCNGESVADSSSLRASEMRAVIRQQLAEGKSEQEVLDYFRTRYGDTILESPPKSGFTALIWVMPVLMLAAGAVVVAMLAREWRAVPATERETSVDPASGDEALSEDERRALRDILARDLAAEEGLSFPSGTEGA